MLKRKRSRTAATSNGITIALQPGAFPRADRRSAILHALIPLFCLSAISFSFAEILLSGLRLEYYRFPFLTVILLLNLVWFCAFRLPAAAPFILTLLLAVHAGFFLLLFADIYNGFLTLRDQIGELILVLYGTSYLSSALVSADAKALTVFMLYLTSLVIALSYLAIYRWRKYFIVLLPSFLVIVLLLMLSFAPGTRALLFFLVSSLILGIWYNMNHRKQTSLFTQRQIIRLLMVTLTLVLLCAAPLYLRGGLSQNTLRSMKVSVTAFFRAHDLYRYQGNTASGSATSGGISGGQISQADNLRYSNALHLQVITDSLPESTIYLQGFCAGEYSSSGWINTPIYDDDSANAELQYNAVIKQADATDAFLMVQDMTAARYPLHPYAGTEEGYSSYEVEIPTNANAAYVWSFHSDFYDLAAQNRSYLYELSDYWDTARDTMGGLVSTAAELPEEEQEYYLTGLEDGQDYSLYEETFPRYLTLDEMPDFTDPQNLEDLIGYIQERLTELCSYTLNPGPVPDGADFTDYFLFENQQGFCMHYATAATILFRLHGVPARYAEGYIANPSDFQIRDDDLYQADLKDNRAHAWTEIYIANIGWIPIETTSYYLGNNQGNEFVIPGTEEATQAPDSQEDPDNSTASDDDDSSAAASENSSAKTTNRSATDQIQLFLIVIAAILAVLLLTIQLRCKWRHRQNQKRLRNADETAALLLLYKEFMRLYYYVGKSDHNFASDYPALYQLVQKAAFSPHPITTEEWAQFQTEYQQFYTLTYTQLSRRKKLLFRFYYCFLTL